MPCIIDIHSHYMPLEVAEKTAFFKVGWSDVDRHLALMDEHGIEAAALLYPTSDAHLNIGGWGNVCKIYNQKISEVVRKHPTRFIGAGILPTDTPSEFPRELRRIEDLGFKIISLASSYEARYLDDEIFYPVYEFARQKKFPIHVHPQILNPIGEERLKDPLLSPVLEYVFDVSACIGRMMMNETFLKFPEVKFIFAHYGGVLPLVKERFDNTYTMLRKRSFVKDLTKNPEEYFKNLYFDTSGSRSAASLLCALEVVDATHILWGSDYPANQNLGGSVAVVKESSALSSDQKKNIFQENCKGLLWPVI